MLTEISVKLNFTNEEPYPSSVSSLASPEQQQTPSTVQRLLDHLYHTVLVLEMAEHILY
jgi:hypothetical protein